MKPKPGQIVMRPKLGGLSGWHSGVALGENAIFHNTLDGGPHLDTLHEFSAGMPVWVLPSAVGSQTDYEIMLSRALAVTGRRYNAYWYNCEDAASEVRYGIPRSPTRERVLKGGFTLLGLFLMAKALGGK